MNAKKITITETKKISFRKLANEMCLMLSVERWKDPNHPDYL